MRYLPFILNFNRPNALSNQIIDIYWIARHFHIYSEMNLKK